MLSGTGVRNAVDGGYLKPEAIGISSSLALDVADWQKRYEAAHFAGFPEITVIKLDEEGLTLLSSMQAEIPLKNIGYYSAGHMRRLA